MNFSKIPLFENIAASECSRMLDCFHSYTLLLKADQEITIQDHFKDCVAVTLSGSVEISRIDINGRKSILEIIGENEMFGRLCSFSPEEYDTVIAKCILPAEILFLPNDQIEKQCSNACQCHSRLISNLLELMSKRTNSLSSRVNLLSQRTIREKLTHYFYQLAAASGSNSFRIPYSMTTLADYLCIDRSAMTRELKNMKEAGIIDAHGRNISLLQ